MSRWPDLTWDELAAGLARSPVVPSAPKPATEVLPLWRTILQLRRNALTTWGEPAYEHDIFSRPFMGRTSFLVNHPDGIRRVLVDNHANYGRTPAAIRILRPILGDGLFLAEGNAWKHQRRTMAPAFAPRSLDVAAAHIARVAEETMAELTARGTMAVDLLRVVQRAALEIAGRSFFSQGMAEHGIALRAAFERYGAKIARPSFLDFLLPPETPSPIDAARWWFARDFKRVLDRMIAERAATPPADPPRDLFDVLVAARDPETGHGFTPIQLRDQIATLAVAGHETTALTMFWSAYLLSLAPEVQELVAAEAADGRPLARARGRRHGPAAADQGRGPGGAAPLPAGLHHRPHGARAGRAGRPGGARRQPRRHGALDPAPPPQALGAPRALRPHPLPARGTAARPLRLPAVRRRPPGVHRRPVRADRGDAGAGPPGQASSAWRSSAPSG